MNTVTKKEQMFWEGGVMKIVVVGDIHVSADYFVEQVNRLPLPNDTLIKSYTWGLETKEEFQDVGRQIERGGSEAVEVSRNIIEDMLDADAIFTHFFPIQDEIIEKNSKLKLIATCRGGVEHISTLASEKGIIVVNTIRNAEPVADFTIGLMYSEVRNISRAHHKIMEGEWCKTFPNSNDTRNFNEYTVGLIGFGNIGQRVAKKLCALGVEVLVYDEFFKAKDILRVEPNVVPVTLNDLYEKSDIISFHVRYDESKGPMVNKNTLALMKPNTTIINTGRAYLIDYIDLYEALKSNLIGGAALDVFPDEPLFEKWNDFLSLDNVTLTPHIAGDTVGAIPRSPKQLVDNLIAKSVLESIFK